MADTRDDERPDDMTPVNGTQTEAERRRHGWKGEQVLDDSDKPNTEAIPDPSRRKPGTHVDPEA